LRRVPLLSGSRLVLVPVADDDVVLRPPPPPEQVVDVRAAVRDALRFPLSGPNLAAAARKGGRATIIVEPPALPVPSVPNDPRTIALAALVRELETCGIPDERQTIVAATGLGRRLGVRDVARLLLPPTLARTFRGTLLVHDAESPDLVTVVEGPEPVRVHPAIVDSDVTIVLGAAETILHGGPGTLLAAANAKTIRGIASVDSLLEAAGEPEWELARAVESVIAKHTTLIGVSLVLDLPRLTGTYRGYPDAADVVERLARSPFRKLHSALPDVLRRTVLGRQGRGLTATAAFAGQPSVAHAEALLRGVALRETALDEPLDALVVGVPWTGLEFPREHANPVTAAGLALGVALRLRRDAFPIRPGGTLVLVHPLRRTFASGTQAPYAAMFRALRDVHDDEGLAAAESEAETDRRALDEYRDGSACHPLLPFADWASCRPALSQLGRVIVAGCRDAAAARTLGFVPSHGIGSALEMAHGVAGGRGRLGILLAPPYPALVVG